jgi:N-methylhydantoinase A
MLVSEPGREVSRAILKPLAALTDVDIKTQFRALEKESLGQLIDEGCVAEEIRFRRQLELRYKGQSAAIPVPWIPGDQHEEKFHQAHKKASGLRLTHPVELVNLRLGARFDAPG